WHWGWRSPEEMRQRYITYAYSLGVFYGEYLRHGHLRLLWPLVRELYAGVRGEAAKVIRPRGPRADPRLGVIRGLPAGFVRGWRGTGPNHKAAGLSRDLIRTDLSSLRRHARNVRPIYFAWQLAMAAHAALVDDAARNRQRVNSEF